MDSSFDTDRPKDARPADKVSNFEAYLLGKDAPELYQTRDEFYNYGRATPKEISSLQAFNSIE